jgi:hypothetical protein
MGVISILGIISLITSFLSLMFIIITTDTCNKYGWDDMDKKAVKVCGIILPISLAVLGFCFWYDATYLEPERKKAFSVEVKNVPEGYRFEGYLVNRDTGERKNVIERAE